jgi:hypothetical protein
MGVDDLDGLAFADLDGHRFPGWNEAHFARQEWCC